MVAFWSLRSLPLLIVCAAGARTTKRRRSATAAKVSTAPTSGASFRGAFRDFSLWVDAAPAMERSTSDTRLWVIEYTTSAEMQTEKHRAETMGLQVTMEEKLSLVLQGNVPAVLGYDACGGETNKTVISVADRTVTERPMPAAAAVKYLAQAEAADPAIVELLTQVSQQSIASTITTLQTYTSRNSRSGDVGLDPAAEWAAQQLASFGFQVTRDTFRSDMTPQIVAEMRGTTSPDQIVVLGAHLDSTSGSSSTARSPGADDNGSGSASVLEFAKLVASSSAFFGKTVRLCLFTGEEQGLIGSRALARRWSDEGVNVVAMVNVDMMGYRPAGTPITINVMDRVGDPALLNIARATTNTYLPGFANGNTSACCSDQQSFHENGFPAAGFFETPGTRVTYPQYHRQTDLLQYIDAEQVAVQASAAFALVCVMAEMTLTPPQPTPAPVPTPPPPTPAPGTWELTGTGCVVDGNCIHSKNYPSNYGNSEACRVQLFGDIALSVDAFNTEARYDFLTVGGTAHSGTAGPSAGTYSGVISWSTDSSVVTTGWKLCRS